MPLSQLRLHIFVGLLLLFLLCESLWPLRKQTQSKIWRLGINLALAAIGTLVLRFLFFPPVLWLSQWVSDKGIGLFAGINVPQAVRFMGALLLLDYTLYVWHLMNHKIPFLWRFHNVHHTDLDLDVTTAARFHFGELALSAGFRALQVAMFGIDPFTLILYETLVTSAAQFHHGNFSLPPRFEKALNLILVTPRMHGIHHSIVQQETDSNFSTIFSFWDRMQRTLRIGIPQEEITIGVAAYRERDELTLWKSLWIPFKKQRKWALPNGVVPVRYGG